MTWSHVMFALASPGDIPPIELDKIEKLTAGLNAELELFHCIYDADVARPGRFATHGAQKDIRAFVELRRQQLEIAAGPLRARGLRVRTSVRWDYPTYEGIVRQVLRHRPDLLIARTTSEAVGGRMPFTRVDFKLIENCPCPVLFIQTRYSYADVVMAAAVDPALGHGKPAALDLEILESASRIRDALSARLLLFHARPLHEHPAPPTATAPEEPDSRLLSLADQYNVPRERVHISEGYAAEALPEFARQQMVDIVVLGAAARSPLRRAVIGHTAERVLDSLACDVLIVKAPGFRSAIGRQSTHHVPKISAISSRYIW
jgi:universal stress protein E